MSIIEGRIEKLENQTVQDTGGREMIITLKDGTVTRFSDGVAPFQTTNMTVTYDQTEEEGKSYIKMMRALFDGKGTE